MTLRRYMDIVNESVERESVLMDVGQTVTLLDLYTERELTDEDEALCHFVSEDDWRKPLHVRQIMPEQAKALMVPRGDTTVWQAFEDHADRDQKRLVRQRVKSFDHDRIVVVKGNALIDGNHHVIAAIMAKQPISYVNLGETG